MNSQLFGARRSALVAIACITRVDNAKLNVEWWMRNLHNLNFIHHIACLVSKYIQSRITQSWFHILWHPTSEDLFWVRSEGANCFWRSWPFRGWGPTTHMPMIWRSAWSHPSRGSIGPSDRGDALACSRIILFLGWKHMRNRKHSSRAVNSKLPTSRISKAASLVRRAFIWQQENEKPISHGYIRSSSSRFWIGGGCVNIYVFGRGNMRRVVRLTNWLFFDVAIYARQNPNWLSRKHLQRPRLDTQHLPNRGSELVVVFEHLHAQPLVSPQHPRNSWRSCRWIESMSIPPSASESDVADSLTHPLDCFQVALNCRPKAKFAIHWSSFILLSRGVFPKGVKEMESLKNAHSAGSEFTQTTQIWIKGNLMHYSENSSFTMNFPWVARRQNPNSQLVSSGKGLLCVF